MSKTLWCADTRDTAWLRDIVWVPTGCRIDCRCRWIFGLVCGLVCPLLIKLVLCAYGYVCMCVYVCMYSCMYACMHAYMCVCMHLGVCTYIYMCVYVCECMCVCVCVCIQGIAEPTDTFQIWILRRCDSLSWLAGRGTVEERTPFHMVSRNGALERATTCYLCS